MRKYQTSYAKYVFYGLLLTVLFLATRLINLTKLPIFTDEAIYIRWSQIGANDAAWRFISLTDGKQPMFTWIMMVLFRVFPRMDPLFVGRLTSVLSGFLTVIGIATAAKLLFNNWRLVVWSVFLYIIIPFSLMYDRLALYDSMVSSFSVWSLILSIILVRTLRLDVALILGMELGCGVLNKSSGFLSLLMAPFALLLTDFWRKENFFRLLRFMILLSIAAILSLVIYSILRLSPLFHMIGRKNTVFVYPLSEWLQHPMAFFWGNFRGLTDWMIRYLTFPVFWSAMLSFFINRNNLKEKMLLFLWFLMPFVGLAMFGKVLYPRFVLFMSLPIIILSAYSFDNFFQLFGKKIWTATVVMICLLQAIFISYTIVRIPIYAQIPFSDRGQMIDDWPSGGGVRETIEFLRDKSRQSEISVYTEGTFGLLPFALEIYEVDNPRIKINGFWPLEASPSAEIIDSSREKPTYVLLNQSQDLPPAWKGRLVFEITKGTIEDVKMRLYEILPDATGSESRN